MSDSLLQQPASASAGRPNSGLWFMVYVLCSLGGGALIGAWLISLGLEAESGIWHNLIAEHGAPRVLRRIQTLFAVILAPWMLKQIGWKGIGDFGWNGGQSRQERARDFAVGFALGLAAIGIIFAVSLLVEARYMRPFDSFAWFKTFLKGFFWTGLFVGVLEETLTRGVLYRSMARAWTPLLGAVVSSSIFAWAHFMKADPASFSEGPFAVLFSSLFHDFSNPTTALKCLNMFLFGIVLCRLVHQRGDIWAATGLHCSAVGLIKMVSKHSDYPRELPRNPWIGHSARFDDSWMQTLLLILLLLGIEFFLRRRPDSSRVHL